MFNALRRATTLITMIGESYLLGARNTRLVQFTVWLMIGGAMLAGFYDFDYNALGYLLVILNCVFTAAYLLLIAKLGKSSGLNTFGLMWYNNVQSIPFVAAICWFNGDFAEITSYQHLYAWDFLVCFLFQSALAFLLNYSIFLCTQVNSALATSVTGQMKNILTTTVGYFSFGDVTYNVWNVVGLVVGVVASSWYSLLKYWESEKNKKTALLPTTSPLAGSSSGSSSTHGGYGKHANAADDDSIDDTAALLLSHLNPTNAQGSVVPTLRANSAATPRAQGPAGLMHS